MAKPYAALKYLVRKVYTFSKPSETLEGSFQNSYTLITLSHCVSWNFVKLSGPTTGFWGLLKVCEIPAGTVSEALDGLVKELLFHQALWDLRGLGQEPLNSNQTFNGLTTSLKAPIFLKN